MGRLVCSATTGPFSLSGPSRAPAHGSVVPLVWLVRGLFSVVLPEVPTNALPGQIDKNNTDIQFLKP